MPQEKRFSGTPCLFNCGLPHFFFHATTACGLLRHSGVEAGKKDGTGSCWVPKSPPTQAGRALTAMK